STLADPLNINAHLTNAQVANPGNDGSFFAFFYDAVNACASPTLEVEITLNTTPVITATTDDGTCGPGDVTLTVTGNTPGGFEPPTFNWYDSQTGGNLLVAGSNAVTFTIAATTTYYVEAEANGCVSERVEVIATVYPLPFAGIPTNAFACSISANGPTIADLDDLITGESTGEWSVTTDPSNTLSIGIGNIVIFDNRPDGDYVFTYTTTDATTPFCDNVFSEVTIAISECDVDTDLDGLLNGLEITLGTDPNNADTDGDGIEDGVEVGDDTANPLDEDEDGIIDALDSNSADTDMDGVVDQLDSANTNPCNPDPNNEFCVATVDLEITKTVDDDYLNVGEQLTFTITVNNISQESASLIRVSEVLDPVGFDYISHFTAPDDGVYDEVMGAWDIPVLDAEESATLIILVEGITFGSYVNTATIVETSPFDIGPANNEASVEVEINERSNNECGFLFNQFSPNGDGTNDFLIINCITNPEYADNSLEIYDRYGNQVFAARSYDNTWDGTRNNNELPKGTYFYVLDLGDGSEIKKGWIQILR
ncbi:MAG: gliding motility-associated C-terminal domain-containing protein, partial [Maribacter sp.]